MINDMLGEYGIQFDLHIYFLKGMLQPQSKAGRQERETGSIVPSSLPALHPMYGGRFTNLPPPKATPPRNKGLIAGLIKGNHWVFISPDHKALFLGGRYVRGGGGRLTNPWLKFMGSMMIHVETVLPVPWSRNGKYYESQTKKAP